MANVPEILFIEMANNADEEQVKYMTVHESVVDALVSQMSDQRKYTMSNWEVWEYRRVRKVHANITITPAGEQENV